MIFQFFHLELQSVICKEIKHHSTQMMVFGSQFKAMLFIIGLDDSSQLEDFFTKNSPQTFFKPVFKLFQSLQYDGAEGFPQFYPTCGCSDNFPKDGIMPEIHVRTAKGHSFCYHRGLNQGFLKLFQRLREFISNQIYSFGSKQDLDVFNRKIHSAQNFDSLTTYNPCGCIKIIHRVSDFHAMKFPKLFFTPSVIVAGQLLERVNFQRKVLDLSDFGPSMEFLDSRINRSPLNGSLTADDSDATEFVEACNVYERKLLQVQGIISDPKLAHLPKLFILHALEEIEEKMELEGQDLVQIDVELLGLKKFSRNKVLVFVFSRKLKDFD